MCGITGIRAFNELGRINMIHLASAAKALSKRGPDKQGLFSNHFVGLGHRRLSIIDLSDEAGQPMSDSTGRYHIVFNGEIFNYQALREYLTGLGAVFKTNSDTEVLLTLYIWEGKECLSKLNGFFAFAVYDSHTNDLVLARDRMGIKPLYYYLDEDKFIFASEMKSIFSYGIEKKIWPEALLTYLQLNYVPAPFTMVREIKKLAPGHFMVVKKNSVAITQWYKVPFGLELPPARAQSYSELQGQLRELLTDSVKCRLVADVPVGTFLSGGTDSSIIAGVASKLHPGIHSFSIGYKDDPFFDETEYADLVPGILVPSTMFSASPTTIC